MMCNNPNVDLVNMIEYIKFGEILSICSQDIEGKQNYGPQSSRKRRITRIATHVFPLGRMICARRESRIRMFF